ncbi:PucR family transcriptional regulator ligand-binding domain-containing protein [Fictibacillus sp. B-59209]|uniref:PucR family transcriptional regulator n=1 Tax=Fictibacillus sp. B-59209 TaxID=3024873 RepID=UPI002E21D05F|nr:PucR family transcriptional regulator ligand-binding domain-containing protein [Fictibacillus sp. B-59209]
MTITVRQLVNNPHLKTKVLAGSNGLEREITWAHVCELQDPTPWLNGGELIMTTGLAIPRIAQKQEEYLQCLIGAGVSGIAIAEGMYAPESTNRLLSEADRNAFPVLLTAYEIPWLAITRTVADANTHEEHARVVQTLRIYEIARQAIQDHSPTQILNMLGEIINCTLHVVHPINKKPLFYHSKLPNNIKEIFEKISPGDKLHSPAVHRIERSGITIIQVSVPASRPATLLAISNSTIIPHNLILAHIATIVGMIIEKNTAMHERQRRLGAEIMSGLIDGRLTTDAAYLLLAEHELGEEPRCIVACAAGDQPFEHTWLHLQLYARGIPHLLTRRGNLLLVMLSASSNVLSSLQAELPANVRLGISNTLGRPTRTPEAYQEALWALREAETHEKTIVYYSEESPVSPFMPRSRSEAQEQVKQVIRDLLAYDIKHNSEFTMTLYVYLCENRSWQSAAKKLHIHKQTLVYRINRIEQMTGRRLNVTNDVAELWFSLQAARMLGLLPDLSKIGIL